MHTRVNNTGLEAGRLQYLYPTQYDVGVDNNDFTPLSFAQVKEILQEQMENGVGNHINFCKTNQKISPIPLDS